MENNRNYSNKSSLFYILPLCLFFIVAAIIYPYYQYRIVSDDFSYLAIAQRYINGDYLTAINGYWSPLNIWILAAVVKLTGWNLLLTSYWLNCFSFAALLTMCISMCKKFIDLPLERYGFGFCMALFWAANIPVTHFADSMNSFLLLVCLSILLRKNFTQKPALWILLGLVSAIAYFSKAYSFYILPLTSLVLLFVFLRIENAFSIKKLAFIWGSIVLSMIVFSFPWIAILHHKYGLWSVTTAGSINRSWAIIGTMYFSDQYRIIVPPSYSNSLSCWEDIWINHGTMVSPFGSVSLFAKQLFRVIMNTIQWFKVISEFSPFYFPIWVLGILYLLKRKVGDYNRYFSALIISFLLFPAGYLMLSFGGRYLWFTVPLIMICGLILFRKYLAASLQPKYYKLFLFTYFVSWLPGAVLELRNTLNEGKSEYEMAQQLNAMHIKGSFIGNNYDDYQTHFRISWFTKNQFYMYFGTKWTTAQLIEDARKQQVHYYYYFYHTSNEDYALTDKTGFKYPEVTGGTIEGLKVFDISVKKN